MKTLSLYSKLLSLSSSAAIKSELRRFKYQGRQPNSFVLDVSGGGRAIHILDGLKKSNKKKVE